MYEGMSSAEHWREHHEEIEGSKLLPRGQQVGFVHLSFVERLQKILWEAQPTPRIKL